MTEPRGRGRPKAVPKKRANNTGGRPVYNEERKRWEARVSVGGGVRRKAIGRTEAECEQKRAQLIEQSRTLDLTAKPVTIDELAEEWLAKVNTKSNRAESTRATVEGDVRRLIIGQPIGRHRVDRLMIDHVEAWLNAMAKRGYKRPTIEVYRKHLNQIVGWAVKRRAITTNLVPLAEWPADITESTPKVSFTEDEAARFIEWCSSPEEPWGPFLLSCVLLGLRPGEACGLRWEHVNFDAGTVHIGWALKRSKDRPVGLGPTKNEHTRTIGMPPVLIDALRRQRDAQETARIVYGDTWPAKWDGFVFLTDDGVPCFQSNIRKQLTRACHDAGVRRLTPYELRHSCATFLIPQLGITRVADMLGTSERMLRGNYHHIADVAQHGAVTAWADILAD